MEEYGKVKKVRIKRDRYGYQQQRAMICFSNEKEAAIAIKERTKHKRWKTEEYKNFHNVKCIQRTTAMNKISNNIKNINHIKGKTTVK